MIKQAIPIFIFLFLVILLNQAGTNSVNKIPTKEIPFNSLNDSVFNNIIPTCTPANVGMDAPILNGIDSIVNNSIALRVFPGCQVLVLKDGNAIYDKCFGNFTYDLQQKVTPTTMYDLASLSKTTGTLLAIMKLYDTGKLKISDKASKYLTFLRGTNKENITISELLFHESGLPAGLPFYQLAIEKNNTPAFLATPNDSIHLVPLRSTTQKYKVDLVSRIPSVEFQSQVSDSFYIHRRFHQVAMSLIANTRLYSKAYVYSCVNFILLKEIVETISAMPLDVFLENEFFRSLHLANTAYLPLRTHKKNDVAPTLKKDFLRNGLLQGYVHDPDAAFLGGISGNAGLFANARDVAVIYQMLLNDGELNGKQYLSTETCKFFTTTISGSGRRGLGFDKPVSTNPQHSSCCISAPSAVYGHTGYTGTCCWVDPINKLVYVFLSNRTYPNDGENKLAKLGIRTKIQELIYQSLLK